MLRSVFRKGLIFIIIILFEGVCVSYSVHMNQEPVLSFTDFTNDVKDATGNYVIRPNIDIYIISCLKDSIEVELKLQLASGGNIQNSELIFYEIVLITDLHSYYADYAGGETLVVDEEGNEIDVIAFSGVGTNELSISFNLSTSDEVCLNLSSVTFEFTLNEEGYFDEYPNHAYEKFLLGKYTNMCVDDNFITLESVNIWIVEGRPLFFIPIKFIHIKAGEQIVFSKDYQGIITKQFIIGFFNVYLY